MIQMPGTMVDGLLFTMPAGELNELIYFFLQVNEKSCRLRMGAYRDRVKRKGDKIVMGL